MERVRREFMSDLGELAELRRVALECCRRAWGDGGEALEQLELALQEAASNIVRHAYDGEKGRPITLDVQADNDTCRLTLTHQGRDFDPATVAPPSFDGSRLGGFGQYLIGRCVDEVCYLHEDGYQGIRLIKRRAPAAGENRMNMLVESFGDVAVVTLTEEQLDAGNADDFRQSVAPVLADHHKLVLDLGRLTFIDSRGCGAILSCLKGTTESGGDLHLCNVPRPVRTVFDFIRLHRICDIHTTKDQAVRAFETKAEARKKDAGL